MDNDDRHDLTIDACGKAFGFVISAALTEATSGKPFRSASFFDALSALCDADRFSPEVSVVMNAVLDGVLAHAEFCSGRERDEIV